MQDALARALIVTEPGANPSRGDDWLQGVRDRREALKIKASTGIGTESMWHNAALGSLVRKRGHASHRESRRFRKRHEQDD